MLCNAFVKYNRLSSLHEISLVLVVSRKRFNMIRSNIIGTVKDVLTEIETIILNL